MAWKGSVYARYNKLWLRVKLPDGTWGDMRTPLRVGEEREAQKLLARVRDRLIAGEEVQPEGGAITVRSFGAKWVEERKGLGVDWENDESRLKHHIYPLLGDRPLEEVRPRHIVELVRRLQAKEKAAKTIRNVYSVAKSLFRDAMIADLVEVNPCVLTRFQLGPLRDRDPEWRQNAVFVRDEVEQLISDSRVPTDRQAFYALLGAAGLRLGEAAGLRWRHYDATLKPLGRIIVTTTYDKRRTKTGRERWVPVHPTLAAVLAEWKLEGWARMMGRPPVADDLVVPTAKEPRTPAGLMRSKETVYKAWRRKDLPTLALRHRRVHDLRRTFITLAREGGADREVLRLVTHGPSGDVMEAYTSFGWDRLCSRTVGKLRLGRRGAALATIHLA